MWYALIAVAYSGVGVLSFQYARPVVDEAFDEVARGNGPIPVEAQRVVKALMVTAAAVLCALWPITVAPSLMLSLFKRKPGEKL